MIAGEADHRRKLALLQQARALLCPIQWEEPFGLIAIEAMLTGTPVIGFAQGSFNEIIDDGITGILVSNVREMVRAIPEVARLSRATCGAHARARFSADRMATDYERVFESMLLRRSGSNLIVSQIPARQSRLMG